MGLDLPVLHHNPAVAQVSPNRSPIGESRDSELPEKCLELS